MDKIIICSYDQALLPEKKTQGAACRDIKLASDLEVKPQTLEVGPVGIKVHMPYGWSCRIYARGGLPIKRGLILANSVGIVDSDYRGEFMFQFLNFTQETKILEKYERIGQIEFSPVFLDFGKTLSIKIPEIEMIVDPILYNNFDKDFATQRGEGRFHSTGI